MRSPVFPRLVLALAFALSSSALVRAQEAKPAPPLAVRADHADALYRRGETVTFQITAGAGSSVAPDAEVAWTISKDGVPPIKSGKVKLTNGSGVVTAQLDEPGFLQCRVTATVAGDPVSAKGVDPTQISPIVPVKPVTAMAGAGVDPKQIAPSLPVPEDFDAFWKSQKEKLAAVPMKAKMTPAPAAMKNVEAFDVQVDALGAPASGYFARPRDAKPKSLPVILTVHGAGVRSAALGSATTWAARGFLSMDINAHGLPNGQPDAFYKDLAAGSLRDYRAAGNESRETVYFLGMFLRELRALDFLCSQPEWDGRTVVVSGASQGGYQAFAAAALDDRVTFFVAGVPAGCDHSGMVVGRVAGWPKIVPVVDGKPNARALEATRYFDNVNFAARTKARGAFVTVGFIDTTCPPTSVYAAFNALPIAGKTIYDDIPAGHSNTPAATSAMTQAIRAHVKGTW